MWKGTCIVVTKLRAKLRSWVAALKSRPGVCAPASLSPATEQAESPALWTRQEQKAMLLVFLPCLANPELLSVCQLQGLMLPTLITCCDWSICFCSCSLDKNSDNVSVGHAHGGGLDLGFGLLLMPTSLHVSIIITSEQKQHNTQCLHM